MQTPVKHHEPLTRSAFLLAFDLRKDRLVQRMELGHLLRAAALAELLLQGSLADDEGRAKAVHPPAGAARGSLPAVVWKEISTSPPRSWRRWIRKDHTKAVTLVRDELAAGRLIRVERRRVLLFPVERVVPRRPYVSRRLAEQVGRAVRAGRPVSRIEQDVRVLAALAAAARLRTVVSARDARANRDRIEQLAQPVEPIATALRKTIDQAKYSSHPSEG
ncbi:GPP34 family phosphoprotein [Nonomuraea sp. NPDC049419]|uniref:GPP34 family phosphoprotein n=1 Tax=Nonomuraea sp. NPDC049419 TaxID=3155772 RepID=UPI003435BC92